MKIFFKDNNNNVQSNYLAHAYTYYYMHFSHTFFIL